MSAAIRQLAGPASDAQRHATAEEYRAFLRELPRGESYKRELMQYRALFVAAYPDRAQWKMAPLTERVGLTSVGPAEQDDKHPSVRARMYLVFLCVEGYMKLDWDWALATRKLEIGPFLRDAGVDLQFATLFGIAPGSGTADQLSRNRTCGGS